MGFWRKCRITFRWFRFTVWLLLLALLGALLWFNRVGLPDFLKNRLVAALREQGVELEFSRMRLSFGRGLVADNVRAGEPGTDNGASFTARYVQLGLDYDALRHRRLALDGLVLLDGVFTLPLSPTNALTLTNLQADLRFGAGDTWSLDHLRADIAGARISLAGEMIHPREALNWKIFSGTAAGGDRGAAVAMLKEFSDLLAQIHFHGEPQLRLKIAGDGRNVHSIRIQFDGAAAGVRTPWFAAREIQTAVLLTAPASAPTNTDGALGFWTNLQPFRVAWSARLGELRSKKLDADSLVCAGLWAAPALAVTNFSAQLGGGNVHAAATLDVPSRRLKFEGGSSFDLHRIAGWLPESARVPLAEISWAKPPALKAEGSVGLPPWTNRADRFEPALKLSGDLALAAFTVRGVKLDRLQTRFGYGDQVWDLPDLALAQGRTELRLSGQASAATRNIHFRLDGKIDAECTRSFLAPSNAATIFSILSLPEPLALALDVRGNLGEPDRLMVTGRVALTNFVVRGQPMDSVAGDFVYSNRTATVFSPELLRAGGSQRMTAEAVGLDFRALTVWITNGWSTADPQAITRAIGPKIGRFLEPFHFLELPLVHVSGSTPMRNVNSGREAPDADLTFEVVRGIPFRWLNLQSTNLLGTVRWRQQTLIVTNLEATLYGGSGRGYCNLDFSPTNYGFDCDFMIALTNVNLHLLAMEVANPTNRLEGHLSGRAVVTYANSTSWRSWQGQGDVNLRDGLLWDVPIFAFMSPVLNTVSEGLGNSRATEAAAKFIITNGVVATDSLLIRAQTMRLQYSGTVDLEQNVNARVTAQFLRNVPLLGPLVSTALWPVSKIFECRVTGRLDNPVVAPVYIPTIIPKILSVPLHPIRTIEELFSSRSTNAPATNAPAAPPPAAK